MSNSELLIRVIFGIGFVTLGAIWWVVKAELAKEDYEELHSHTELYPQEGASDGGGDRTQGN